MHQKRLAISMGGGGARAFCYFGFIRELEANGIEISLLMAYSGSAIMLCYLFDERSDEEVIKEFSKFNFMRFISFRPFTNGGFLSHKKTERYLQKYTKHRDLEDLPYQTCVPITDVTDPQKPILVWPVKTDFAKLTAISSTVPPAYPLYKYNGRRYADGGTSTLYGSEKLRKEGAEVIIGLFPDVFKHTKAPLIVKNVMDALKSVREQWEDSIREKEKIDLEIRGFDSKAGLNDFKYAKEMYLAGRKRAREVLPQIKKLIFQ